MTTQRFNYTSTQGGEPDLRLDKIIDQIKQAQECFGPPIARASFGPGPLNGISISTQDRLVIPGGEPYQVRRTWKERLFSRPWRPWVRTRTVTPMKPDPRIYQSPDGYLVGHPVTVDRMIALMELQRLP